MSKTSRAIKRARRELSAPRRTVKARDPADIATMIPYLLGFYPAESLVVVAIEGERQQFGPTMRIDLVEPDEADRLVDYLGAVIKRHGFKAIIIAAFSERPVVAAAVVESLRAEAEVLGVAVVEAIRTDGSRWWSYTCDNVVCCDPDGVPFEAGSAAIAADAVLAGLGQAESRDALRACFDPAPDDVRTAVAAVAREHLDRLSSASAHDTSTTLLRQELAGALGSSAVEPEALGRLTALVQLIHLRDDAWAAITRKTADQHFELWRQAMCAAPSRLGAPVGTLAGWAAWLSGRGVLASHASEWVAERSPGYAMNRLLQRLIDEGVNPAVWEADQVRAGGVSPGGGPVASPP